MKDREDMELVEDLFAQPGWAVLSNELEAALAVKLATALDSAATLEQLWLIKGEVQQLRAFLGLPDQIREELVERIEYGEPQDI